MNLQLPHRLVLQLPRHSRLPSGAVATQAHDEVPVYARVEVLSATTYRAALAEQTGCELRVLIRQRLLPAGVLFDWKGRRYRVKNDLPAQAGFSWLMCGVSDGNG